VFAQGWLETKNIALLGFMTAGKTQVGLALAGRTGLPFRDVDALIEGLEREPIHRIFQLHGEPYFRALESRVLSELCAGSGQILSCGGGTVLAPENRQRLRERCVSIWLGVSPDEALRRLGGPDSPRRPLLEGRDVTQIVPDLMRQREVLYAQTVAGEDFGLKVETDGRSIEEVAKEIALRLGLLN